MTGDPVTLMTFDKEEDAEIKQMLLEQEGIESFLNNANVATLNLGSIWARLNYR
ncbi:MAG: hypothetical protein QM703_01340 [Gemmatales bacterium]